MSETNEQPSGSPLASPTFVAFTIMTTTDENKTLAIAVCPDCNCHSVCDPAWLRAVGQTLKFPCDNCGDDRGKEHLIIRYAPATHPLENSKTSKIVEVHDHPFNRDINGNPFPEANRKDHS